MLTNRSNYPRIAREEEVIKNYLPWQWAILFLAVLSPGLLSIWAPSLRNQRSLFIALQRLLEIGPAAAIFILPFAFSGGSLARAMWDRIKEPASFWQVLIAVSGTVLIALSSIYKVVMGSQPLRPWPGTYLHLNLTVAILHGVYILTLFVRNLMPLLILCIPNMRDRLSTYAVFATFHFSVQLTGLYMQALTFPTIGRSNISLPLWIVLGIVHDLIYYAILWVLDRACFPTLRPFLIKIIVMEILFTGIGLKVEAGWLSTGLSVLSLAIVVVYATFTRPGSLRLKLRSEG